MCSSVLPSSGAAAQRPILQLLLNFRPISVVFFCISLTWEESTNGALFQNPPRAATPSVSFKCLRMGIITPSPNLQNQQVWAGTQRSRPSALSIFPDPRPEFKISRKPRPCTYCMAGLNETRRAAFRYNM